MITGHLPSRTSEPNGKLALQKGSARQALVIINPMASQVAFHPVDDAVFEAGTPFSALLFTAASARIPAATMGINHHIAHTLLFADYGEPIDIATAFFT